jgi:hypothetical protein
MIDIVITVKNNEVGFGVYTRDGQLSKHEAKFLDEMISTLEVFLNGYAKKNKDTKLVILKND